MTVSHVSELLESPALQRLGQFVREREREWQNTPPSFEQFEHAVHDQMMALERELLTTELARYDGRWSSFRPLGSSDSRDQIRLRLWIGPFLSGPTRQIHSLQDPVK